MSDRSHTQRPSQSTRERSDQPISVAKRSSDDDQDVQRTTSAAPLQIQQQNQPGSRRPYELPPLPQVPGLGNFPSSGSRLASVSSILNLTEDDDGQHSRRRKISDLASPMSSSSVLQLHQSHRDSPQPMLGSVSDHPPRRILTPRSPSLHRAASLSSLNQPFHGTIDAQQTPFLVSPGTRTVTIEPGVSGVPPLPTFPASIRPGSGFPAVVASAEDMQRTASTRTYDSEQASASASPGSTYPRYGKAEQLSPDAQYAYSASKLASVDTSPTGQDRARPAGIPISSSGGQNVYQMMTLETTSGTVQLPVDVQAASRVADEKRRRNAGASARFRQRRKEKEKEASTTISQLEQQLKDAAEDAEFYRRERDHLANMLIQTPSGDRHFPRPQSPRRRRPSIHYVSSAGSVGSAFEMQDEDPPSPDEFRNVRRRTSNISGPHPPPLVPQTAHSGPGGSLPAGYVPSRSGMPLVQQHALLQSPGAGRLPSPLSRGSLPDLGPRASSLSGSYQHHTQQHPQLLPGPPGVARVPQLMQAPPQTGPWNPYAAGSGARGPPGAGHDNR